MYIDWWVGLNGEWMDEVYKMVLDTPLGVDWSASSHSLINK